MTDPNTSERPKPLGFDLRDRIAAVTRAHRCFYRGERVGFGCHCGWVGQSAEHDLHVADTVIRELGLKLQREEDGDEEPKGLFTQHRYVTDWKTDE